MPVGIEKVPSMPESRNIRWGTKGAPVLAMLILAECAIGSSLLAQPGSTGGTIGNADKSVSGGSRSKARRAEAVSPSPRAPVGHEASITAEGLAGKWRWTAHCNVVWTGDLEIGASSASQFSGTFLNTGGGTIYDGHLRGREISFFRRYVLGVQHWGGTLLTSGREMQGSLTEGNGGEFCAFEATKE